MPTYGDLIVLRKPTEPEKFVLKRVIGLENDKVFSNAALNDQTLTTVPKGHVWIEGDNASNSMDSRDFGPVPIGLIRGYVKAKINGFSIEPIKSLDGRVEIPIEEMTSSTIV